MEGVMKHVNFALVIVLGIAGTAHAAQVQKSSCASVDLDQGWDRNTSEEFWFTSQGSRLMPYSWFLALEVADPSSTALFHAGPNMERYGYISVPPSPRNMDGLPIGFAKDIGGNKDEYVGLTCAACHTGSLNIAGKTVIVEGGPALANFWPFLTDVISSLSIALSDSSKFDRFSKTVLKTNNPNPADLSGLRQQMQSKLTDLNTRLTQNTPANPAGNGRVDAFGHIFTHFLAQDLNIPANAAPPYAPAVSAPVSYPFLWDTPQHDVVQWNGSAPNTETLALGSLSRNLGEVIGVFGELEVTPGRHIPFLPHFSKAPVVRSSAKLDNMARLEDIVRTLWSPAWPQGCMPFASPATLEAGKKVYDEYCAKCHRLLGPEERKDPDRKITAELSTLDVVQTDPTMAMNFAERRGLAGPFRNSFNLVESFKLIKIVTFGSEASGRDLLLAAVDGVLLHDGVPVTSTGLDIKVGGDIDRLKKALEATTTPRYKARPLDGIWATAPYLHNGSVPTLYDLLNLPDQRPKSFYVGSRLLDPKKIGLDTTEVPDAFLFDTSVKGNWNNGHEFGTQLSRMEKDALLEFLKTL
jgi:hypothetical protein